ncbi:36_t:CDS:2 [Entrophospora sp. SA101]|nr:36_t:CDS:2 [Entrophospora sp. SA101]
MSNFCNIFRENNTDSDSDEENSQEENSTISTSQPGRELDESDILNQQRRRVQQPTTQLNTTPVIGSNNQFTNQSITNNIEQQVTTMDATQFNQLIAALGQLTQQLGYTHFEVRRVRGCVVPGRTIGLHLRRTFCRLWHCYYAGYAVRHATWGNG